MTEGIIFVEVVIVVASSPGMPPPPPLPLVTTTATPSTSGEPTEEAAQGRTGQDQQEGQPLQAVDAGTGRAAGMVMTLAAIPVTATLLAAKWMAMIAVVTLVTVMIGMVMASAIGMMAMAAVIAMVAPVVAVIGCSVAGEADVVTMAAVTVDTTVVDAMIGAGPMMVAVAVSMLVADAAAAMREGAMASTSSPRGRWTDTRANGTPRPSPSQGTPPGEDFDDRRWDAKSAIILITF